MGRVLIHPLHSLVCAIWAFKLCWAERQGRIRQKIVVKAPSSFLTWLKNYWLFLQIPKWNLTPLCWVHTESTAVQILQTTVRWFAHALKRWFCKTDHGLWLFRLSTHFAKWEKNSPKLLKKSTHTPVCKQPDLQDVFNEWPIFYWLVGFGLWFFGVFFVCLFVLFNGLDVKLT